MAGVVIVGAGPLIGRSVARRFGREGLPVAVIARTPSTVEAIVADARDDGYEIGGWIADATDEQALRRTLDAVVDAQGLPDALIYNAAIIRPDRPGELSARELLDTLAVNVAGAVVGATHLGTRMAEAGRGTIVITGGMPELVPAYFSLSLGKAGVRAVSEMLAKQLGPSGVHVVTVTVGGAVARGGAYDPDEIADCYWELHRQSPDRWKPEVAFDH
ncbi:MAG: SDR family NAD(P)-dependent oxidoreductase [Solirubrobacteraceae bacterium]